jgi:hypothetical protein
MVRDEVASYVARERYIQNSSSPETVAEVIYRAATDGKV